MAKDPPLNDPTALARFGNLELVARLVVEGYAMGQHKSPYKGTSIEFVEHRQYYPGDEIRHIDWRAYGKTGRYYVKEYEDETNLRCYLIVDTSGSMGFADSTVSKSFYARQLAAALSYLLFTQRDAVGLYTFDSEIRDYLEPSTNPQTFQRISKALQARDTGGETSLAKVFQELVPRLKRRSLVIVISDCYDDLAPLTTALKMFRHNRQDVILFQVVAPEEETFPFSKPTQFRSLERPGYRKLVDPHRLRQIYIEQYQKFEAQLAKRCGSVGVDFHKLSTADPYHVALGAFLDARARIKSRRSVGKWG